MKTLIMLRDMLTYEFGGKRLRETLEVDPDDTIYSVMAQIEDMTGVPAFSQRLSFDDKSFYFNTPGTLAENELVPTYPAPISVDCTSTGWHMLQRETLRRLGFCVDDDRYPDASELRLDYPGQKKTVIPVTDYIRMDGRDKRLLLLVEAAGATVASLMEAVQRRRGYPLAMQELHVSHPDNPYTGRRMDKLDATLADYNVKEDSQINLYMDRKFGIQNDREARKKVNKAKEIATPAEMKKKKKMQLFVTFGKTYTLAVDPDDTVYSVMAQIEDKIDVPPILQSFTYNGKSFYYDTPGTLADHKLVVVPSSPDECVHHSCVHLTVWGSTMLRRQTLLNLGFYVDDDDVDDKSVMRLNPGHKKLFITVTDYIRMDGGDRKMALIVEGRDTVARLMETVQRRRHYPVAMQEFTVDAGRRPYKARRRMDKLDATLADYNVREDSIIELRMSKEFAIQADREARKKVNKAKEIAAPAEQQKLADDEK